MIEPPIPVGVGTFVRALKGITPQVEDLRQAQLDKRFRPELHTLGALLHKDHLPIVDADGRNPAVIVGVEEELARALVGLAQQVGQDIVAIDMDFEILTVSLMAFK